MVEILVPAHALPARSPAELIAHARQGLTDNACHPKPAARYAAAHLAALRAAAAVLAARARPAPTGRKRITTVWALLALCAPEIADWANYFATSAAKRAAAEACVNPVTAADADRLTGHATQFVQAVESLLGLEPVTDGSGR